MFSVRMQPTLLVKYNICVRVIKRFLPLKPKARAREAKALFTYWRNCPSEDLL